MLGDADQRSHHLRPAVLIALFWTPYADWIYAVVSCTGLEAQLACCMAMVLSREEMGSQRM